MVKRILLVILTITIPIILLHGQSNYYKTDTSTVEGIQLIDGGEYVNSSKCAVIVNGKSIAYTPDYVIEYGFKNGRVYVSKYITLKDTVKKVFLNRIMMGKISFYSYNGGSGKKYYLEKDSAGLVEITKIDTAKENYTFRDILKNYMQDCDFINDQIQLVSYNKSSISKLIDIYNKGENRPLPFIKYGITLGIGRTTIIKNTNNPDTLLNNLDFNSDNAFSCGIFADFPLNQTDFTFHPELYYQKNGYKSYVENNTLITDYVINTSSISLPLLLRYSLPLVKLRPFLNLGFIYTYNYVNKNEFYLSAIDGNIIEDHFRQEEILSKSQYGYVIGAGIQYRITPRNFIHMELRQNGLYDINNKTFGINRLQLLTSFNF